MATISPVPFLLLLVRRGWRVAIESAAVAALLVAFLTGPFSAFAVGTLFLRGVSLGIGLRRGWRVSGTILAGTAFLWVFLVVGVVTWSLAIPSWRSATEHGISLTLHQGAGLAGTIVSLAGFGAWWHGVAPRIDDAIAWFLRYWLYLLPLVAWPVLLVAETAEYVILEVIMPRFGVHPPPLRLPGRRSQTNATKDSPNGARARLVRRLERRLAAPDQHSSGPPRGKSHRLATRVAGPMRPLPQEAEAAATAGPPRESEARWAAEPRPAKGGKPFPAEKSAGE